MHKLIEYCCDELEEIERKASKGQKLSMQELQVADLLAHMKKNLLKGEEMSGGGEYSSRGYSRRMSYDDGRYLRPDGTYSEDSSYARGRGPGAARDSMGRYSSESVDEHTKQELMKMIERM